MSNRFFAILLIILAIIGGVIFVNKSKNSTTVAPDQAQLTNLTTGSGTTGVTLIEYGDFQCPVCATYYPIVKQITEKYGDKITFQFRNFPLSEIHQNAVLAARAALAADKQGKFWEFHDILYENQNAWSGSQNASSIFEDYAQKLSLNGDQFKTDMASSEVNAQIQADRTEAQKLGLTGTPTFILDGKKLDPSPTTVEAFSAKIDEAIKAKQSPQQ